MQDDDRAAKLRAMAGDNLKQRREALHITQGELARQAGVSRSVVLNAENGRETKTTKLKAVLDALDAAERKQAALSAPTVPGEVGAVYITVEFTDRDGARATYRVPVGEGDPYDVAQDMIDAARLARNRRASQ